MQTQSIEPDAVPGFQPAKRALPFVANVSWPRSGHGLLVRILKAALGDLHGYCEYYGPKALTNTPCCGQFPCTNCHISMTKQHDFNNDTILSLDIPLVVQYRSFIPSVVSHFEYALSIRHVDDKAVAFERFAREQAGRYSAFARKWIARPRANCVLLPYERLTAEPISALDEVIALYGLPNGIVGNEILSRMNGITYVAGSRAVARRQGVSSTRDVKEFRFYSRDLFDEIERLASSTR
jgi:hypothetical protein